MRCGEFTHEEHDCTLYRTPQWQRERMRRNKKAAMEKRKKVNLLTKEEILEFDRLRDEGAQKWRMDGRCFDQMLRGVCTKVECHFTHYKKRRAITGSEDYVYPQGLHCWGYWRRGESGCNRGKKCNKPHAKGPTLHYKEKCIKEEMQELELTGIYENMTVEEVDKLAVEDRKRNQGKELCHRLCARWQQARNCSFGETCRFGHHSSEASAPKKGESVMMEPLPNRWCLEYFRTGICCERGCRREHRDPGDVWGRGGSAGQRKGGPSPNVGGGLTRRCNYWSPEKQCVAGNMCTFSHFTGRAKWIRAGEKIQSEPIPAGWCSPFFRTGRCAPGRACGRIHVRKGEPWGVAKRALMSTGPGRGRRPMMAPALITQPNGISVDRSNSK